MVIVEMKGISTYEAHSESSRRAGRTPVLTVHSLVCHAALSCRVPVWDRKHRIGPAGPDRPSDDLREEWSDPPGDRGAGQSHRNTHAGGKTARRTTAHQSFAERLSS